MNILAVIVNYGTDQLNYLEGMDGLFGMASVGLKYGPESV